MGDIKTQMRSDLTAAMKARDEATKSTLRMALAAIQYAEVAGDEAVELSTEQELAVITKEYKNRRESAQTYADAGRQELADKENGEAEILSRYLPKPLSEDELTAIVDEEVARASENEPATMKQMGMIVKAVNARVKGRADGKTVATMVRSKLA